MMKKVVILAGLSLTVASHAAITSIAIEEKTEKEIQLSEQQINRIAVTDGIVSTVIANPTKFNIRVDDGLGQAFVTLFAPIEEQEGLTVITDSGFAQDFLVTSREGSPEVIYLEEPHQQEAFVSALLGFSDFYDLYHGRSVEGFVKRILHRDEALEVGELLPFVQDVMVYSGDFEDIYVVTLRNHGRRSLTIDSPEDPALNWFFCPVSELKPKEATKIVISKARA